MRSAILFPLAIASAASAPCTSEQACRDAAAAADMSITVGEFRIQTKGCFTKGGRAFWSPADTYEEMASEPLYPNQERLYCDGDSNDLSDLIIEDGSEEVALIKRSGGDVQYCMSAVKCEESSQLQGLESFQSGDWQTTKGCFSKNGAAYWSNGSPEQITAEVVAPLQERVYCGLAGKDDFLLENGSSLRSIGIASAALVAVGAALM